MLQEQLVCNLAEKEPPGEEVRRERQAEGTASAATPRLGNGLGEFRNQKEGRVAGWLQGSERKCPQVGLKSWVSMGGRPYEELGGSFSRKTSLTASGHSLLALSHRAVRKFS